MTLTQIFRRLIPGMSRRDKFAASALSGFLANPKADTQVLDTTLAEASYEIADAMLAERGKSA